MNAKQYLYETVVNQKKGLPASGIRFFLRALSYLYLMAVKGLACAYAGPVFPKFKADKKIISVGNITLGGTGKTPFELYLAAACLREKKVVIISGGCNQDELDLLQYKLPHIKVFSGRNRARLIKKAQDLFDPDVIILDDGFQQWRIKKDIDIVLIDSSNPFSNGRLLPAGFLREPLSGLRRADIFVLTKTDECPEKVASIKQTLKEINRRAYIFECRHGASGLFEPSEKKEISLKALNGRRVFSFSAIGSAESFTRSLEKLGARIAGSKNYLDHHRYLDTDIDGIIRAAAAAEAEIIVTTEKDWMRLDANMVWKLSANQKFYLLKIAIEAAGEQEIFDEKLFKLLNS